MKTFKKFGITLINVFIFSALTGFGTSSLQAQAVHYVNPPWAPAYYPGVRYYYIPDIETYYDLSNQDFVYLENGQWLFSYGLPSIYSGFDLYTAHIIALDIDVYQPWMHHQFYVSNYPRFYYRSIYKDEENANIRGFNENERRPFYSTKEEKERMNQYRNNVKPERRTESSRPPQKAYYYGKNIGQPVKVHSQMRENSHGNQGHRKR
jgi:hypothetical protein